MFFISFFFYEIRLLRRVAVKIFLLCVVTPLMAKITGNHAMEVLNMLLILFAIFAKSTVIIFVLRLQVLKNVLRICL